MAKTSVADILSWCMQGANTKFGSIWIDVTELFDHFRFAEHPTGVSRVVSNLVDALKADHGEIFNSVRLLFWDPVRRCPITAEDSRLTPLSSFLPRLIALYSAAGLRRIAYSSRGMKALATSLPRRWRYRVFPSDNGVTLFSLWAGLQGIQLSPVRFAAGDCLFVPGSFWLGQYAPHLAAQANAVGVPVTAFVHDVLLLSRADWLPRRHSEQFRRGCDLFLPACAAIICNSSHTRGELRRLVPAAARLAVYKCRLGDQSFGRTSARIPDLVSEMHGRKYVLFVSTITPRKNHKLLVEAWRRLWRELGPSTPYLLFVGGGSPDLVLSELLAAEKAEGGRIIRISGIDDGNLEALYEHAWMTAYSSLAEGYGIPVAEALSRGKICLAAPSGGIREIDENLIDFIDPLDPESVTARVKTYLRDEGRHSSREAEIKKSYRSTDWSETARLVRSILERTVTGPASFGEPIKTSVDCLSKG